MNIVGRNVHKYRTALKLSLEDLGRAAGWDKKNLHRLENTGKGYSPDSIGRLAKALDVKLSALFDEAAVLSFGRVVPIDVYTAEMITRDASGKDTFERPAVYVGGASDVLLTDGKFADNAFAFKIQDDAMKPEFNLCAGDVVIVDPGAQAEPNDLVLASVYRPLTGKSETMVRRYATRANGFELLPSDIAYSAEKQDGANVGILGKVVEQRGDRR